MSHMLATTTRPATGLALKTNLNAGAFAHAAPWGRRTKSKPRASVETPADTVTETIEEHQRNLWVGGTVLLGLGAQALLLPSTAVSQPLLFGVAASATLLTSGRYLRGMWLSIKGDQPPDTDTLLGVSTISALLLGQGSMALGVVWLYNLGDYLQKVTLRYSEQLGPRLFSWDETRLVWLVTEKSQFQVPQSMLRSGDTVLVTAGEQIPVDGEISRGRGVLNEACHVSQGENQLKTVGDMVFAGSQLLSGTLYITADKTGEETRLGRLLNLAREAQRTSPRLQQLGEQLAPYFVPASLSLTALTMLLTQDPVRALSMLLIASPNALRHATPTAINMAVGHATTRQTLITGRDLERLAEADTLIFDKTGTLTHGQPQVTRLLPLTEGYSPAQLLTLARIAEQQSKHPLAQAIRQHAQGQPLTEPKSLPRAHCATYPGLGITAFWGNQHVALGNRHLMAQLAISLPDGVQTQADKYAQLGETVLYLAHQKQVVGLVGLQDPIRTEMAAVLNDLRKIGLNRIMLLTSESKAATQLITQIVGLTEWHAELKPAEKEEIVARLQEAGQTVAFITAAAHDQAHPLLAQADVVIQLTEATEADLPDDLRLVHTRLGHLLPTMCLSQRTQRTIHQNYGLALLVTGGGVLISATGFLSPMVAALLDNLSTLGVALNSARLNDSNAP